MSNEKQNKDVLIAKKKEKELPSVGHRLKESKGKSG